MQFLVTRNPLCDSCLVLLTLKEVEVGEPKHERNVVGGIAGELVQCFPVAGQEWNSLAASGNNCEDQSFGRKDEGADSLVSALSYT